MPRTTQRTNATATVLDEAVEAMRRRLADIESQIVPMLAERDELREALRRLGEADAAPAAKTNSVPRARRQRKRAGRAPRGANREKILQAINDEPKTSGEVAAETGLNRNTVATTLTKLVAEGKAAKAERGYRAAS